MEQPRSHFTEVLEKSKAKRAQLNEVTAVKRAKVLKEEANQVAGRPKDSGFKSPNPVNVTVAVAGLIPA